MGNSDTDQKASYGKAHFVAQQICSHTSTFHLINSFVLLKPPQGFGVPVYRPVHLIIVVDTNPQAFEMSPARDLQFPGLTQPCLTS